MDLTFEHADFVATTAARDKARDLYDGNDAVKAKDKAVSATSSTTVITGSRKYLYQGNNEVDADYQRRLKRAALDPYVEKIITARQALMFGKAHKRVLPPKLESFFDNCDREHTPASVFFREAAQDAQIDGIHWVLIDMPILPENGLDSAKAEADAGHRPFFQHVPGANVIDWDVDSDGQLSWAKIYQAVDVVRSVEKEGWLSEPSTVDQWKVWTRDKWVLYEEGDSGKPEVIGEGDNVLGVVPIVPFFGVKNTSFSGWPVCRSIVDHVIQMYNRDSDLDWGEYLLAHPIPYTIGPEPPIFADGTMNVSKGFHLRSVIGGGVVAAGYMETSGAGFSSNRDSIKDLRFRILNIALSQSQRDSAQVRSEQGQREDRKFFSASVHTASELYESAERRCWEIMAQWVGESPDSVKVEYSTDYDDKQIEAMMVSALGALVSGGMLTEETMLKTLSKGELLPEDVDVTQEVKNLSDGQIKPDLKEKPTEADKNIGVVDANL